MPIPAGQSCANCQFYDAATAPVEAGRGWCLVTPPGGLRFNIHGWPRVAAANWCSRWQAIGAVPVAAFAFGALHGRSDTALMDDALDWTLLTPDFTTPGPLVGVTNPSAGVLQFDHVGLDAGTPLICGVYGSITASPAEGEVELTVGLNGAAQEIWAVRLESGSPQGMTNQLVASERFPATKGDTVGIFVRSPGAFPFYDYHFWIDSRPNT